MKSASSTMLVAAAMTVAACTSGSDAVELPGATGESTASSTSSPVTDPPVTAAPTTAPTTPATAPDTTPPTTAATPEPAAPTTAPAPVPTFEDGSVFYREGDESPEISIMQLKLIALGYLEPGASTGVFDATTTAALKQFQTDYALGVDGIFGPLTNRALTAAANSVNVESG